MLTAIKKNFQNFNLISEDKGNFYFKAKTGPSKVTKIPKKINEEISCYTGIIIGDGHIAKNKKRIAIELVDLNLIKKLQKLTISLFMIKSPIYKIIDKRPNRKIRYKLQIDNSMIHTFFNKVIGIPKGNKSSIVCVPSIIKRGTIKNKKALLIGLFVADGGKRYWTKIGLSTASRVLREDVSQLLNEIKLKHSKDQWIYKKYKKEYFGIYFTRKSLNQLMWGCRSGQTGQFLDSFLKKIGG